MTLSSAERYARWRAKQLVDPEKREKLRQKEKDKYQKRKEQESIKPVYDLSAQDASKQCKQWRTNQRKQTPKRQESDK